MANANTIHCKQLFNCDEEKYREENSDFQANPSIAITEKGRMFVGYHAGGSCEPHIENYCVLICSDDLGETWRKVPVLIIPGSEEDLIHVLDIQLWISPEGKLHVFWTQDNVDVAEKGKRGNYVDGYLFNDKAHASWVTICENPDAEELVFTAPKCIDKGFLRNKPLVLECGRWINCNYTQDSSCYEYSISDDKGETYRHMRGEERSYTHVADEAMAYQKKDGRICMLARTRLGELAQMISYDNAESWTDIKLSGIESPYSRFFIARTPSDNIILIKNDHRDKKCKMTAYLSDDDGETWKYKKCIDEREFVSCPDAAFYEGKVYVVYNYDRNDDNVKHNLSARWQMGKKDIVIASFDEKEIKDDKSVVNTSIVCKGNV